MAASDSDLLKELECAICQETYTEPKVAGTCNHSFCKKCLERHIRINARLGSFFCPVCKEICSVPADGVNGLTTNFTLANIIEKYNDVRKDLSEFKWNKCSFCIDSGRNSSVGATLACPQCDGISLCDDCGENHLSHPRTEGHEVTALCELHGKPLSQYCKSCGRPICVVCFGKHSSLEDHEVVDYKDVLTAGKEELEVFTNRASFSYGQLRTQHRELKLVKEGKLTTKKNAREAIEANFTAARRKVRASIAHHTQMIEHFRSQIKLTNQKKEEEESRDKRILELEEILLRNLDDDYQKYESEIRSEIKGVDAMEKEIQNGVDQSKSLVSVKLLKADLKDHMEQTKDKLEALTVASGTDRVTLFKEKLRVDTGLSEEYVASAGRFSCATVRYKLESPEGSFSSSGVAFMSKDKLAACGRMGGDKKVAILWTLPCLVGSVFLKDDALAHIAAQESDKVVVLRRKSPILRVINVVTEIWRNVDVELPEEAKALLWSLAIDSQGNFIVSYGKSPCSHIILINSLGSVLQDIVEVGFKLTFCKMTSMLMNCTNHTISFFKCYDNCLWKVMSGSNGIKGYKCSDTCSGSLGDRFVVGVIDGEPPKEIRLYQLDVDECVILRRINIQGVELKGKRARCSSIGNYLAIGNDRDITVFTLSA